MSQLTEPILDPEVMRSMVEEMIPIHKLLGLKLLEAKMDYIKVRVPFSEYVIGDFRSRRWHGGIIGAIMDAVGGMIGLMHITSPEDKLATIDLRIDYLRGAKPRDVIVEGHLVRLGNRILVASMKAWNEGEENLVAEGKGVYNFIRKGTPSS